MGPRSGNRAPRAARPVPEFPWPTRARAGEKSVEADLDQAVGTDVPSECPSLCKLPQLLEGLSSRHAGCPPSHRERTSQFPDPHQAEVLARADAASRSADGESACPSSSGFIRRS